MSIIQDVFKKGPAYVAYLIAGDGGMKKSLADMLALIEGGVDILEIGMPFSDPVADGPTITKAAIRSLDQGTTLDDVLNLVKSIRQKTEIPIILFTYYNPIFIAASQDFYARAKAAGVNGILTVDLPLEESQEYQMNCKQHDLDPVFLVAPSTPIDRVREIARYSKGMLYYVCRKGVTGVKNELPEELAQKLAEIKSVATLPVVVGFGISNKQMAESVIQHADGFVVGSLFVKAVEKGMQTNDLTLLAQSIDPRRVKL